MTSESAKQPTGAQVLARMLDGYGVTHLFMVPAVLRRTMTELERSTSIERIHTHGEKSAAYMADGYARASGRPGICGAQIIGAMNLAAGLREPWLAHSPVIALTGGRDPRTKYKKVYQEVDDVPAFEQVTKLNATVDDVTRIPDMLRQAYRVATSGTPGPVHLQFAGNEGQLDAGMAELDDRVEERFSRIPAFRPEAGEADLRAVIARLAKADRPVIVAGGGVRSSAAGSELIAFAESLGIPVATSLNGRDSIPGSHPLCVGVVGSYARESANKIVRNADLVIFIGTETGGMTTNSWTVPTPGTTTIQIDIEPENIGRNYPPDIAVNGDARAVLQRLLDLLPMKRAPHRDEWLAEVAGIAESWAHRYQPQLESEEAPTRPERICHELTRLLPDDSMVVVDTGHAGMWMGGFFDLRHQRQSYLRSCGHLGWAFPAGLGAKCAVGDRPTVVFTGDAGFWYHLAELETACRWHINTVTVVNNNSGGNQSKRGFDRAYGGVATQKAKELWSFTDVNLANVAEAIGAVGIRVSKPADFAPALESALEAGRPTVIDVVTDIGVFPPPTGS